MIYIYTYIFIEYNSNRCPSSWSFSPIAHLWNCTCVLPLYLLYCVPECYIFIYNGWGWGWNWETRECVFDEICLEKEKTKHSTSFIFHINHHTSYNKSKKKDVLSVHCVVKHTNNNNNSSSNSDSVHNCKWSIKSELQRTIFEGP